MTPLAVLALLYPYLADAADPRFVAEEKRLEALALAVDFRPYCLPPVAQTVAQAHYAAHLLFLSNAATSGSSSSTGALPGGEILEWAEGDVRIRYAPATAAKTTSSTSASQVSPYAAWKALADMCPAPVASNPGGTGTGTAQRRGFALLTGRG